ncbi:hypothetical protein K1719_012057 [Acacia pycnantha]|nr:hypothetical protein K1719_012057 [Acacia pycnantha]
MVYGTNTSGFGWDPDTKCVTADKEQRAKLRRCWRDVGSKYKSKDPNSYDDYEEAAKWKRDIEAKEAKKKQHAAKNKGDATSHPPPSAPYGPSHANEDGAGELGALFGQLLDDKLGLMKAQLAGMFPKAASKKDQGRQDSIPEETGESEHVDEVNSDEKLAHGEDDSAAKLSNSSTSDKPMEGDDGGSANGSEGGQMQQKRR